MPEVEGEHRVCVKVKNWRGRALQNTEGEVWRSFSKVSCQGRASKGCEFSEMRNFFNIEQLKYYRLSFHEGNYFMILSTYDIDIVCLRGRISLWFVEIFTIKLH